MRTIERLAHTPLAWILRYIAVAAASFAAVLPWPSSSEPQARVTSVAFRVHNERAMVAFYTEAFGARFRTVSTHGIRSQFADLQNITLKFVPIREKADFTTFPTAQLGLDVVDISHVIAVARRHGGRVQDAPVRIEGRLRAAVRDPDGNTIELTGK